MILKKPPEKVTVGWKEEESLGHTLSFQYQML
jgi:hypothetical protein